MKRAAVTVLSVVALSALAWLLWGSATGPGVAGVYRIDPHSGNEVIEAFEAAETSEAGPYDAAWIALIRQGVESGTLTLSADSSLTWTMGAWTERGRWELADDRVFLFFKREGREEWPFSGSGLLVGDGTLVIEGSNKPLVLRRQ